MARPTIARSTSSWLTRRRTVIWLGILLVGVAAGLGLAFYPYPPLPTVETEAARAALQIARREAAQFAPKPLAKAVTAATVMERLYAYDRSRWFRFSRLAALDQAISETQSFAEQASTEARQVRAARFEQADEDRKSVV